MGRLKDKFDLLKKHKKKGLIPFITAGDPDLAVTESLVLKMEESGADIIELGIPFSDPLADGPTIQRSHVRALKNNTSIRDILKLTERIRKKSDIPLVIMSSYNPVFSYGNRQFVTDSIASGIDGIIIPDLPPEESEELSGYASPKGLDMIFLLSPVSDQKRVKTVVKISTGFIYYISVKGITGTRNEISTDIKEKILSIRKDSHLPVAIGFGISNSAQAKYASKAADAIVIGSAIVKIIEDNINNKEKIIEQIGNFVFEIKKNLN